MEAEMGCPKDGTEYIKLDGKSVCPKCGHVAGYKQIDIVQVLKENEQLKLENEQLKKDKEYWIHLIGGGIDS